MHITLFKFKKIPPHMYIFIKPSLMCWVSHKVNF